MEELNYEGAAKELDAILEKLKSDSISIDQLAIHVERASVLLKFCSDKLQKTESKVNEVISKLGI